MNRSWIIGMAAMLGMVGYVSVFAEQKIHTLQPSGEWQSLAPATSAKEVDVSTVIRQWEQTMGTYQALRGPEPIDPQWRHEFDTLESKYYLHTVDNKTVATDRLPADERDKGDLKLIPILRPGQAKGSLRAVLNGYVWTPLVAEIGTFDLTTSGPVSNKEGFSLDEFRKSSAVIPFKNGYAVNLCGIKVSDGYICRQMSTKNYKTSDGRSIPGRLFLAVGGQVREILITEKGAYPPQLPRPRQSSPEVDLFRLFRK